MNVGEDLKHIWEQSGRNKQKFHEGVLKYLRWQQEIQQGAFFTLIMADQFLDVWLGYRGLIKQLSNKGMLRPDCPEKFRIGFPHIDLWKDDKEVV